MSESLLTYEQIIFNIGNAIPFEAYTIDKSFFIKIEKYEPYVCFAIHDGHALRDDLLKKISLNERERWYEEVCR